MGVDTQKFIRKPLYVDAVRVSAQNFDEIVAWCQGEVQTDEVPGSGTTKKFIKVRVHNPKNPRQTKAFIGDWLLYTERGYKVYTNKAFRAAFDQVEDETSNLDKPLSEEEEAEIREKELQAEELLQAQAAPPVIEEVDEHTTPQGEPHEYVEATPETIAAAVNEQQPRDAGDKMVLSEKEQSDLGPDEVRELVRSGEAILIQDLAS